MSNHVNSIYIEKDPRYRMQAQLPVHGTGDLFNDLHLFGMIPNLQMIHFIVSAMLG